MLDLLIRQARLPRAAELQDIGIRDGRIVEVTANQIAGATLDAAGALVAPALVEPHIHLDAVLTVGQPRFNFSGSLFEGIAIWGERVKDLTVEDVNQRVRTVLRWQLADPAVTCVIPATTDPAHMVENMAALHGPLPDRRERERLGAAISGAAG